MNKNKRYRVWMLNGCYTEIEAQKVELYSLNDKPLKIKFLGDNDYLRENDYLLAEFYCDMITGWAEVTCLVDYSS